MVTPVYIHILSLAGISLHLVIFITCIDFNWPYMRRSLFRIFRPVPSLVLPVRSIGIGQKYTMSSTSISSNTANGKPNTWKGAGDAEFDLRSKLFCCPEVIAFDI